MSQLFKKPWSVCLFLCFFVLSAFTQTLGCSEISRSGDYVDGVSIWSHGLWLPRWARLFGITPVSWFWICLQETPTSSNFDPGETAENLANFVKNNSLDGADIDWEDSSAFDSGVWPHVGVFVTRPRVHFPSPVLVRCFILGDTVWCWSSTYHQAELLRRSFCRPSHSRCFGRFFFYKSLLQIRLAWRDSLQLRTRKITSDGMVTSFRRRKRRAMVGNIHESTPGTFATTSIHHHTRTTGAVFYGSVVGKKKKRTLSVDTNQWS